LFRLECRRPSAVVVVLCRPSFSNGEISDQGDVVAVGCLLYRFEEMAGE
jgi:hypothetical protein